MARRSGNSPTLHPSRRHHPKNQASEVFLPQFTPAPLVRIREPFDDPGYIYELKMDGFRALAEISDGQVRLISRRGNTYESFSSLYAFELQRLQFPSWGTPFLGTVDRDGVRKVQQIQRAVHIRAAMRRMRIPDGPRKPLPALYGLRTLRFPLKAAAKLQTHDIFRTLPGARAD
jgi:ATP-dependent DNA ligase